MTTREYHYTITGWKASTLFGLLLLIPFLAFFAAGFALGTWLA